MVSPGSDPLAKSRHAARSRIERTSNPCTLIGDTHSVPGDTLMRPRVGFNPTTPHAEAGMRKEPPPSVPCATGTISEATAAHDPPLDPPGVRVTSHGFLVGPQAAGSVVATAPNSGVLVRPMLMNPACRMRAANSVVTP